MFDFLIIEIKSFIYIKISFNIDFYFVRQIKDVDVKII